MGNTQSFIANDNQAEKFIPVLDFEKFPILLPKDVPQRQFSQRSIDNANAKEKKLSDDGLIPWPQMEHTGSENTLNDSTAIPDRRENYSPPQLHHMPMEPLPDLTRNERSMTESSTDSSILKSPVSSLAPSPTSSPNGSFRYENRSSANYTAPHARHDVPHIPTSNSENNALNISNYMPKLEYERQPSKQKHLPAKHMPVRVASSPTLYTHKQRASNTSSSRSPSSSVSDSIKSQLSILSQHTNSGSSRHYNRQNAADHVDAGVPPQVPVHRVFSNHRHSDKEKANDLDIALAIDSEMMPERRRSKSFSTVTIPKRRSSTLSVKTTATSPATETSSPTDVFTRKCSSPVRETSKKFVKDNVEQKSKNTNTPENIRSFVLGGYDEGRTKLIVVNADASDDQHIYGDECENCDDNEETEADLSAKYNTIAPDDRCKKYFVKSKAQIAEEEELRSK